MVISNKLFSIGTVGFRLVGYQLELAIFVSCVLLPADSIVQWSSVCLRACTFAVASGNQNSLYQFTKTKKKIRAI